MTMNNKLSAVWKLGLILVLVMAGALACSRSAEEEPTPTATSEGAAGPAAGEAQATATPTTEGYPGPGPGYPEPDTPTPTTVPTNTPTPVPGAPTNTPTATTVPVPTATPTATTAPGGQTFEYTVKWGDTLYSIARRFGTTVEAIAQANNISDMDVIFVGQVLTITGTPPAEPTTYTVKAGDTLFRIAAQFNTTVEAIARANNIVNPHLIFPGQVLTIPGGTGQPDAQFYTVQPGDTLTGIALRFGTTVQAIVMANNLPNPNFIFVGQVLRIP